jgi:hypothetical protein
METPLDEPLDAMDDDNDDVDPVDFDTIDELDSNAGSARRLDADSILDSLVPQSIDWRDTVRRHPVGSVLCVGLVGYLVGRTKGAAIMSGLTAGLSAAMMRQLSDVFEGDFFDY